MMNTFSALPRKTAQPPLVGRTARTCTSITVLFIWKNRIRAILKNKRAAIGEAKPLKDDGGSIDLLQVVNEARARGLGFPLVIRFQDLLRHRVETVNRSFQNAIAEFGYRSTYRGVFPI